MKKILLGLLLSASALSASAQYQFPNSDFESAFVNASSKYTEPEGWHGYATIDASGLNGSGRDGSKLVASTDVRPGSTGRQSVYIKSTAIIGIVANGVMTNGQIGTYSTTATDGTKNYNFSTPGREVSTYAPNSKFYTPFTGKPDAMRVWLKNMGTGTGRVSVWLHTNGTMYDPTDNANMSIACAHAETRVPNNKEWTKYDIPFSYAGYNGKAPEYILATFTTNETPGQGAAGDMVYIDDIEMLYYSELMNLTYNGQPIEIDPTGSATIDDTYNTKMLKFTTGVGASVTTDVHDDGTVTITIEGNDISVNPGNRHVYTLHFTKGLDASLDDEPFAPQVAPETSIQPQAPAEGRVYILNHNGKFLDKSEAFTDNHIAWTVTGNNEIGYSFENSYTEYTDPNGPCLYLERNKSASQFDPKNFDAWSFYKDASPFQVSKQSDGGYALYRYIKFYDGGFLSAAKSDNIYLISTDDNKLTSGWVSHVKHGWTFYDAAKYDRVYDFWPNYNKATVSNGINATMFVEPNATVSDLPLGLYSISGTGTVSVNGKNYTAASGKFYVPCDNSITFTGAPGLTYYGRLNFDLTATYNGAGVKHGDNIDDVYDEALFVCSANGNGAQEVKRFFDPETYTLTVTVSGYGRSREHTFQFAAPDLSLNATWYGEKVEDGQTIDEEFSEAGLNVTPGKGATVKTEKAEDGTVTITLSSATDSKEYTLHFVTYPAETGDNVTVDGRLAAKYDNVRALKVVPTLGIRYNEDGNINLSVDNIIDNDNNSYSNIVVKNVSLDADGNFYYSGNVRNAEGQLVPTIVRGVIKDNKLVTATIDASLINPGISPTVKRVFMHATYGLMAGTPQSFPGSIVVTVNGDATEVDNQTINVGSLGNGNISFTLNNFAMPMGAASANIGNIAIDNLPIDADGNFAYNGGILIGPGTDNKQEWGGLDLGIVPLDLRGQVYDFNGQQQLIVVIDIDMQQSLGQTIHVTFGADAVKTDHYSDDLNIVVNGEKSVTKDTQVEIGTLRNGNVNLVLKDFKMSVNGAESPIGNIAIDNVPLDAKGNFVYSGVIRIGKGSNPTVTWGGPELGDVPVTLRGAICSEEFQNHNGVGATTSHCVLVLDVDMQKSLEQTIHITYGLDVVDTKNYTDILAVTVNGETTTQEQEVTVQSLPNGNINFFLDNFTLQAEGKTMPIGAISIENLIVDEQGKFSFDGSIRIGEGSTPGTAWGGPELGDVPLLLDGQLFEKDGQKYLLVNIDIDMEEALGQTINVTFGATPVSTKTYTDDLQITVNGEVTKQTATIETGMLKNGYMNFNLKNFAMEVEGQPMYIGNIAINALQLDEDGRFTYNGNVRIGEGDLEGVASWGGPDLGAIPLELKGQLYEYEGEEYMLVNIAIELESLKQTIDVLFGGTPVRTVELRDDLVVTINGQENRQEADVTVGILRNGNINFTLRNFELALDGSDTPAPIGNLAINNMELAADGTFSFIGNIRIGNGDAEGVAEWGGPGLGDIPVVMTGKFSETNKKLHAVISIDLSSLDQKINVEFGADFIIADTISDIVGLIEAAKAGKATVKDIEDAVNMILGR